MLRMSMFLTAISYALVGPAMADPYWVSYEGSNFPENEGWTRTFSDPNGVVGQGGAVRTIEDGVLTLDSLESVMIVDFYQMSQLVDPSQGEMFLMQWRMKVDQAQSSVDPGVSVFSDGFRAVGFEFSESGLHSVLEPNVTVGIVPYVFHDYELRSSDMLEYELWIDGLMAISGDFLPVFEASRVGWGDVIQGGRSLTDWDYVRFGVVPEPGTALGCGLGIILILLRPMILRSGQ